MCGLGGMCSCATEAEAVKARARELLGKVESGVAEYVQEGWLVCCWGATRRRRLTSSARLAPGAATHDRWCEVEVWLQEYRAALEGWLRPLEVRE